MTVRPTADPFPNPIAFSYLRFSRPEQAKGDSVRRQAEAADAWASGTGSHSTAP
jgi:hypothetical protein